MEIKEKLKTQQNKKFRVQMKTSERVVLASQDKLGKM